MNSNSNLPVVTVEQFVNIVKQSFEDGISRPIFGLGKGGIGKTESIMHLCKDELHIGYVDVRLLLYAETDLKGIPYPDETHTRTVWLQNNILPTVEKDGETGILVLDEITSVSRSVRTAAYQLLNERCLGEYRLPEKWMVVCLGNGEEDGGDFEGMEGNFANRCSIYNVVPNLDAWKLWAFQNNINYLVTGYVSWRPSDLHTYSPENETDMLFASPRSWKAVSDILNRHPFDKNDELLNLRILSNIGSTVGNMFIAFCKYKESSIEPADVLAGKAKSYTGNSNEILFMTMQGIVKLITDETKADIKNHGEVQAITIDHWANAFKWMLGLTALEHQVMGIKDIVNNNNVVAAKLLLNADFNKKIPELREFVSKNQSVFRR